MTFATRTLGYLGGINVSVIVGTMTTTTGRSTLTWWGWSTISGSGSIYYPDSPVAGSVIPSPLYINGVQILGIASVSTPASTTSASGYYVYVAGNNTTLISTLTVAGVTMTSPTATFDNAVLANVANTRYLFSRSDTTTLFGTTVGASVPVLLT